VGRLGRQRGRRKPLLVIHRDHRRLGRLGGWYDNAAPKILDYRGLGIRVPCLIISPYAKETSPSQPGYVSHTQYEYGSILKFIEEAFQPAPDRVDFRRVYGHAREQHR